MSKLEWHAGRVCGWPAAGGWLRLGGKVREGGWELVSCSMGSQWPLGITKAAWLPLLRRLCFCPPSHAHSPAGLVFMGVPDTVARGEHARSSLAYLVVSLNTITSLHVSVAGSSSPLLHLGRLRHAMRLPSAASHLLGCHWLSQHALPTTACRLLAAADPGNMQGWARWHGRHGRDARLPCHAATPASPNVQAWGAVSSCSLTSVLAFPALPVSQAGRQGARCCGASTPLASTASPPGCWPAVPTGASTSRCAPSSSRCQSTGWRACRPLRQSTLLLPPSSGWWPSPGVSVRSMRACVHVQQQGFAQQWRLFASRRWAGAAASDCSALEEPCVRTARAYSCACRHKLPGGASVLSSFCSHHLVISHYLAVVPPLH